MLPEFKSGTMRTLARPSKGESGHFLAAMRGLMAASSWSSPSMMMLGLICLTSAMAELILSMDSSLAEPLVEKERTAIFGSSSRSLRADS